MISGERKEALNIDTILSKISEYDVYRYYMNRNDWEVNRVTLSPFRTEVRPSFVIYAKENGTLNHIDYSESGYRGSCFDFVRQLYGIDLTKAMQLIDRDFNLGIRVHFDTTKPSYKQIVKLYQQPDVKEKKYSHIQVVVRKFNLDELAYWNLYHQDVQDLRDNNVYAVSKLYLNKRQMTVKKTELTFGYLYDGHWKIYRPYNKEFKWVPNNVPITMMDGRDNLMEDKPAFINKSKKDYMVVKKLYPYTCAVQNEGLACFSQDNVKFIQKNSSRQILSFDSDGPGVKNSLVITNLFSFEYCNVPNCYLQEGIKDWSDLAKKYGMTIVEHYLKQKKIIE
jgi:hypothetical protein